MDPVTLLIVAIASVAVGYIAGILIGRMGKDQTKSHAEPSGAPHTAVQADGSGPLGEQVELAALFRSAPGAPLSVRMGGQLWENAAQAPATQLVALEGLVREFQQWLKPLGTPANPDVAPASPATPVFIIAPPVTGVVATNKPPFIEAKTIVGQIDEILQEMLVLMPAETRKIRLIEIPNQGVAVLVGQEQYPGIDAVPDADVRNLIRQAVSTWEVRAV
jgi:hypothetical protein